MLILYDFGNSESCNVFCRLSEKGKCRIRSAKLRVGYMKGGQRVRATNWVASLGKEGTCAPQMEGCHVDVDVRLGWRRCLWNASCT